MSKTNTKKHTRTKQRGAKHIRTRHTATKQTRAKQNTYNRNIQDSKVINLSKMQINDKETDILAASYK